MLADALDLVVYLGGERTPTPGRPRRRVVETILEVTGADGHRVAANEVFTPDPDGVATPAPGRPLSQQMVADLAAAGLPDDWWWIP